MAEIRTEIKKCKLFQGVSDKEISDFLRMHPCRIRDFGKDDCIITREEQSSNIGVVLNGTLGIYSDSYYGGHALVGIGGRDYLFGFIAMFYNQAHSITSLYSRGCRVAYFSIPKDQSPENFIANTSPRIISNIFDCLTKHIRDDFNHIYYISSSSVSVKLARFLLYNVHGDESNSFCLTMNRTELANYLSVYRTTLSRELTRMIGAGIITLTPCVGGSMLRILRPEALIEIEKDSI